MQTMNAQSDNSFILVRIVLDSFYLLIFYSEKLST